MMNLNVFSIEKLVIFMINEKTDRQGYHPAGESEPYGSSYSAINILSRVPRLLIKCILK